MNFYVLYDPGFLDTPFAYGEEKEIHFNTGEAQYCTECGNPISMLEWLPPYEVNVSKKALGDLIFGTIVGFLASKKFKNRFEESNLRGLDSFKKVDLYYRNRMLQDEYYYPEIPILNAFVDIQKIDFQEKNLCNTCQKGSSILSRINGITFTDPAGIDKDVFFTSALGQATIIVTQDFKNFSEKNGLTNAKFIEASEYKWDSLKPSEY